MFIVFEGIDGSGKTTQAKKLTELFRTKGLSGILTREPGGTDLGEQLKYILDRSEKFVNYAECLLFYANRCQHVKTVIDPALRKGDFVICDRFHYSTLAYQGYGKYMVIPSFLQELHAMFTRWVPTQPDLVFFLDIEPKIARERLLRRGEDIGKYEKEPFFLEKVFYGYKQIVNPIFDVIINANQSEEEVFRDIVNHLPLALRMRFSPQ